MDPAIRRRLGAILLLICKKHSFTTQYPCRMKMPLQSRLAPLKAEVDFTSPGPSRASKSRMMYLSHHL